MKIRQLISQCVKKLIKQLTHISINEYGIYENYEDLHSPKKFKPTKELLDAIDNL